MENLEIGNILKDEDKNKRDGVIDALSTIL